MSTDEPKSLLLRRTEVDKHKRDLAERARARAELDTDGWEPPEDYGSLADELSGELPPLRWVVDQLVPEGGNVLLNAQYKAGKTTAALNLARSLTDGTPLFDHFSVDHADGAVAWWNAEVDRRGARQWMAEMGFQRPERLFPEHLRGHSMPLMSEHVQDWAVDKLSGRGVRTWIVDPFGALFTGDENSNTEVRDWLRALDEIKRRAGVDVLVLVAHTGHASDDDAPVRARGATRLMDWADAIWTYRKGNGNMGGRRYLAAYGRDVDLPETALDYAPATRSLYRVAGAGSRAADARRVLAEQAALAVRVHHESAGTAMSKTALELELRGKTDTKRAAINEAVGLGWIKRKDGPNRTQLHWPGESPNRLAFRPRAASEA